MTVGTGVHVSFAEEYFNLKTPVSIHVRGFVSGNRIRIVGIPTKKSEKFHVNLNLAHDTAFHFNPRFHEKCVVRNNTKHGVWQQEERYADSFPFVHETVFTLEFVAIPGHIQIFHNGHLFTQFSNRDDPSHITTLQVEGDVDVHSIHISH